MDGLALILPARCGKEGKQCWFYHRRCSSPASGAVLPPQRILALLRAGDLARQSQQAKQHNTSWLLSAIPAVCRSITPMENNKPKQNRSGETSCKTPPTLWFFRVISQRTQFPGARPPVNGFLLRFVFLRCGFIYRHRFQPRGGDGGGRMAFGGAG